MLHQCSAAAAMEGGGLGEGYDQGISCSHQTHLLPAEDILITLVPATQTLNDTPMYIRHQQYRKTHPHRNHILTAISTITKMFHISKYQNLKHRLICSEINKIIRSHMIIW